ncbi:MAG: endonuclease III [Candidatus Aminicenantes bacterium]|nr:endonuclease III [Candidatus Aminicenantes bacterium]
MPAPDKDRVLEIIRVLKKTYPDPKPFLHFRTPMEILAATILSAQCTDKQVNLVTPALFRKYPDVRSYAESDPAEFENDIRSTGFFRNKARSIRSAARKILDDFGGDVPSTMDGLLTLPGVARKTANIVLQAAFHKAEGIAVDVHVFRVSRRLDLSAAPNPEKAERDLLAVVPRAHWGNFNFWVVSHGRAVCQARKPGCLSCPLRALCPFPVSNTMPL